MGNHPSPLEVVVKLSPLLALILLGGSIAPAQKAIPPGVREADKAEAQTERNVPPPSEQARLADTAKLKRDADELARLAQSIPAGVESVQKGTLPTDLLEKLKQIEKLSKRLRSEIKR